MLKVIVDVEFLVNRCDEHINREFLVGVGCTAVTVTKLTDRDSIQTVGVVTDVEPFLRGLVHELAGA